MIRKTKKPREGDFWRINMMYISGLVLQNNDN